VLAAAWKVQRLAAQQACWALAVAEPRSLEQADGSSDGSMIHQGSLWLEEQCT
jgi:hypothetical protein